MKHTFNLSQNRVNKIQTISVEGHPDSTILSKYQAIDDGVIEGGRKLYKERKGGHRVRGR